MHELKTKLKIVEKIYHVSDIHLRNVQRHREFRSVFNNFYEQVKSDASKNAIIFIGGDIAHAKTEMSPELVTEIADFFTKCANLHPTVLIAGNHDCNLNNPDRLDVLTPIVDMLNSDNLFYLRDTGVYKLGDVAISVFGIFDDISEYVRGKDITDNSISTKIAVYHGAIKRSKTDVGYVITGGDVPMYMFDGYDMVMLGDIHKYQILQEYHTEALYVPEDTAAKYVLDGWECVDD